MLFVLGEDAEERGVEIVLQRSVAAPSCGPLGRLTQRDQEIFDLRGGLLPVALLGGEDSAVERHGAKEQVEQPRRDVEAAESQIVEDVLKLVRQPRHPGDAEERREALE